MHFLKYFSFFLLLSLSNIISAQTTDNISWFAGKVFYKTKLYTFSVTPIVRFNDNFSNYQNSSIDVSAKRSFKSNWHLQLLSRSWLMPNRTNRQFLWIDFGYQKQISNLKLATRLRWHHAFDVKEIPDADFIRWKSTLSTKINKVQPFIGIEPWLRINTDKGYRRLRIEPGFKYKISKLFSFTLMYRRELSFKSFARNSKT